MPADILGMPVAEWATQQVRDNQMLVAIVGGMLLGSTLYLLRSIPQRLWRLFLLQFTVVVEVHNDSGSYEELLAFLVGYGLIHHKTRRLTLDKSVSICVNEMSRRDTNRFGQSENVDSEDHLTIGQGWHFFWYQRRPFLLEHTIGEPKMRERPRTLTLRTFGRSRAIMQRLVKEASDMRRDAMRDRLAIWTFNGRCWEIVTRKTRRPLETVVLDSEQKFRLTADLEWFMENPGWYQQRGIPYRRGYLLYGPPGTGKTSLIFALASHYGVPVYMLNLSTLLGDDTLMEAMGEIPDGVFLLIEDIDAAGVHVEPRKTLPRRRADREIPQSSQGPRAQEEEESPADDARADAQGRPGVTLSGLMNALDGIASPDRLITFMTTNHPEHIEPALIRPGRVDRHEEIGHPGRAEARAMFLRFFPASDEIQAERFAEACQNLRDPITAAELQELCMEHADDPQGAVDRLMTATAHLLEWPADNKEGANNV